MVAYVLNFIYDRSLLVEIDLIFVSKDKNYVHPKFNLNVKIQLNVLNMNILF